jgi:Putative bacterial sensory transduction regulator
MWKIGVTLILSAAAGLAPVLAQTNPPAPLPSLAQPEPTPAPAADGSALVERITGAELASVLQEIGWKVEAKEIDGKPLISASFSDAESGISYDFTVGLYRCDEATKACYDIMFMRSMEASKPVTLMMVNKYNASQIFGVAYLNDDGSLGLSLAQTIQGGVTRQNLKEMADWWKTVMTGFDAKVTGG